MNILLLEPDYPSKYPPLGLMKIAAYHKRQRGDFVWFAKGKPQEPQNRTWDRIYITTLFTYEWQKTIEIIDFAKQLVPIENILVGGVLATLMPEELEAATGIKPMTGLLRSSKMLGFDDDIDIDCLTPDYSILDNTAYTYFAQDAYFTTFTKGCGMKCSFCAVQRLEPNYEPYRNVAQQITEIDALYGPRKNLMLLDNNVLISNCFDQIIEEIIALGFGKGATMRNPKTGKQNQRFVDFNQGLDANLLTPHKAAQLARLAIRPARIAFDHIDDREKYLRAVTLAEQAGIDEISNYLLYNTPNFSGKGKPRRADLPEDLYERMRLNVEFAEQANARRTQASQPRLSLYSYPMSYCPLDGTDRSFIGENWNPKTHQAVRRILCLTKGVAYARRPIFEALFGENAETFRTRLWMPVQYLGHCLAAKAAQSSENTRQKNPAQCQTWEAVYDEWMRLFNGFSPAEKSVLCDTVRDAKISAEKYCGLTSESLRKIYLHYFSSTALVSLLEQLRAEHMPLFLEATAYLRGEGRVMLVVNELLLTKLKSGEALTRKLRSWVDVYVVQKAYRVQRRVEVRGVVAA
jgi:hypothetical protein